MSIRLSITAASLLLVLLSQKNADAGFLVEQGDVWHAVGDNVGSGPVAPEAENAERDDAATLQGWLSMFLTKDAAHFGRIGCSTPGGMSSSAGDSAGSMVTVFVVALPAGDSTIESCNWLRLEGAPRLPPPLATMILQPPRA